MQRTLVALVIALAVLGAGCSSPQQPSAAVQAARRSLDHWEAAAAAATKAEAKACLPGSGCPSEIYLPLEAKTCSAEAQVVQAEAALDRAEGRRPIIPSNSRSCTVLEES